MKALGALRAGSWLPPLVVLGLMVLAWQLVAVHNREVLPTVPAVLQQLGDNPGLYLSDAGTTLQEVAVGGLAGGGVAFLLAVAMSELPLVRRAVMPLAVMVNVTPVVSFAPALALIFGFGMAPRYIVTALVVFFPFLINSLAGLASVDPEALDLARTLHASRLEVLWRLRLPSSLPFLFAAARICLPLGVVGAVVAEFVASSSTSRGLGALVVTSMQNLQPSETFAAILVLALLGIALTLAVALLERRLLLWHPAGAGQRAR